MASLDNVNVQAPAGNKQMDATTSSSRGVRQRTLGTDGGLGAKRLATERGVRDSPRRGEVGQNDIAAKFANSIVADRDEGITGPVPTRP